MDLKRVELAAYNGLPHLLVPGHHRAGAGQGGAQVGRQRDGGPLPPASPARRPATSRRYNETRVDPDDRMPYIVIVIDELADLMMREGKNVEDPIVRLAQKARATGIHMVLATQRPSVNVVTGLIKANFPSRIAFAMASQIDSRTILDTPGAEDLIGRGDMLYQPSDLPRPMRLQGVFVSDPEIGRVAEPLEATRSTIRTTTWRSSRTTRTSVGSVDDLADEEADRLLPDAVEVIREYDRASASLLQRRLKVGYARAARIDRPAGGARLHRCVRRLERPCRCSVATGAGARRRRSATRMGTTDDDARSAATSRRAPTAPGRRRPPGDRGPDDAPEPARAPVRRARARRASTSTAPSATRRSGPATSARSSGATTRSCRAPSTRRASCATTRCTSGWTPTRSSSSGAASAATPASAAPASSVAATAGRAPQGPRRSRRSSSCSR